MTTCIFHVCFNSNNKLNLTIITTTVLVIHIARVSRTMECVCGKQTIIIIILEFVVIVAVVVVV